MSGPLILGIDGGGSKTLVAVADQSGEVLQVTSGGGTNPMDNPRWREELNGVVGAMAMGHAQLSCAVAGLPSYGEVAEFSRVQREAISALLAPVPHRLLNDVDAAHLGALAGGPGILILSGTGSMAWARDDNGTSFRVGGWGEGFGDEGSAYWIGLRAIALASRHLDGRGETPGLVEGLFGFLGLDRDTPHDSLAGWFGGLGHRRSAVAALAPLVDHLASAGDPDAMALVEQAAEHLALHITAIARRSGGTHHDWSYAGGTFRSRLLLDTLARKVGRPPRPPMLPPIGGALLCAARDLDWPVDEAWIARLAASIEKNAPATRGGAETKIRTGE